MHADKLALPHLKEQFVISLDVFTAFAAAIKVVREVYQAA
jgi:hypothetical protein